MAFIFDSDDVILIPCTFGQKVRVEEDTKNEIVSQRGRSWISLTSFKFG